MKPALGPIIRTRAHESGTLLRPTLSEALGVCGSGAHAFADLMQPYGMRVWVIEGPVGSASAVKNLKARFDGHEPADYHDVLPAIADAGPR